MKKSINIFVVFPRFNREGENLNIKLITIKNMTD